MFASLETARLIWPKHIENKEAFIFIGSITIYFGFQTIGFLMYLPGYMGWSKYYDDHLINKRSTRPWERKNWPEVRLKTIKNLFINQILLAPLAFYVTNKAKVTVNSSELPNFM